jgi:hypothetical protein
MTATPPLAVARGCLEVQISSTHAQANPIDDRHRSDIKREYEIAHGDSNED